MKAGDKVDAFVQLGSAMEEPVIGVLKSWDDEEGCGVLEFASGGQTHSTRVYADDISEVLS